MFSKIQLIIWKEKTRKKWTSLTEYLSDSVSKCFNRWWNFLIWFSDIFKWFKDYHTNDIIIIIFQQKLQFRSTRWMVSLTIAKTSLSKKFVLISSEQSLLHSYWYHSKNAIYTIRLVARRQRSGKDLLGDINNNNNNNKFSSNKTYEFQKSELNNFLLLRIKTSWAIRTEFQLGIHLLRNAQQLWLHDKQILIPYLNCDRMTFDVIAGA